MAERTTITVHDKKFTKFISSAKITKAVDGIANSINKDFKGKRPVFISVLNGSFMFTADLLKKIKVECRVSFIKTSSYSGTESTGKVKTIFGINEDLSGKHIIILEDIVDSGDTLEQITSDLQKHSPAGIKIATLLFKPDAYKGSVKPDYVGLEVPNDFLVGYGLDYNGSGRNLSDIYKLKS